MNKIKQLSCEYLASNRTVEVYLVSNQENELALSIYNYKGVSFSVFNSKHRFEGFWKGLNDGDYHFNSEKELDHWLKSFMIK